MSQTKTAAKLAVKAIPDGYRTVTTYLVLKDAAKAIEFYTRAFGAQELFRMPGPDGKGVMHAEIKLGDSIVMLTDECPVKGNKSPLSLGGTPVGQHLYVTDVDAVFKKATAAGAKAIQPPTDMFWGDRFGKVLDPFGHEWSIATHVEDLSPQEIGARGEVLRREGVRYLLLIYTDEKTDAARTEGENNAILDEYRAYTAEVTASGKYSGDALDTTSTATSVRVRGGKKLVTDGPFAETKEQLGGFYCIEAKDLDEAIHWASKIPSAKYGTIEVRPIWEVPKGCRAE